VPAVVVRPATRDDLPALLPLVAEMQAHYADPPLPAADVRARLERALFADRPLAQLLLAEAAGAAVGLLTWNTSFPAGGLGTRLVIEDLYVAAAARNRGVGGALLRSAAATARRLGADELAWSTDPRNGDAQRFYERLGARRIEKVIYRLAAGLLTD